MDGFWDLTPKELWLVFKVTAWRWLQEQKRDAWLAWHIAALTRAKRLPSLASVMPKPPARKLSGAELRTRQQEFAELTERYERGRRKPTRDRQDTDSSGPG